MNIFEEGARILTAILGEIAKEEAGITSDDSIELHGPLEGKSVRVIGGDHESVVAVDGLILKPSKGIN